MDMWSDAVRRPIDTAEDFIREMLTDKEAGEAFAKACFRHDAKHNCLRPKLPSRSRRASQPLPAGRPTRQEQ